MGERMRFVLGKLAVQVALLAAARLLGRVILAAGAGRGGAIVA